MTLLFDRSAVTKQHYEKAAWTIPNADWCVAVTGLKPVDPTGSEFGYVFSSGIPLGAGNMINLNINAAAQLRAIIEGATLDFDQLFVTNFTSHWSIVIQRVGGNVQYWIGKNGEPMTRAFNTAVAIGAITQANPFHIGARTDTPTTPNRNYGGQIHKLFYIEQSLTREQINAIHGGTDITDLPLTFAANDFFYKITETSGSAPSTLTDLINANDATLQSGAPTATTNPTYYLYRTVVDGGASAINGYSVAHDDFEVSGWEIDVTSSATGADSHGIRNTAYDNVVFDGLKVRLNSPAGAGIRHGTYLGSAITGGTVKNCYVYGPVWASNTPHGIITSTNTNCTVKNNIVKGLHVGLLMSNCDDITTGGNIYYNQNGPAMYMKGVVNANPSFDTVIHDGRVTSTNNGLIAATYADAIDCTAGDFSDIDVIVYDPSKIRAFAQISGLAASSGTPQPVTMTNITFYTHNEWDPDSEDKFIYTGVLAAAANTNWTEWQALTETVNNRLIQLPKRQIREMINDRLADKTRLMRSGYSMVI